MTTERITADSEGLRLLVDVRPPAPDWFAAALAKKPERRMIEVAGAAIETLIWGERGRPGLLFMHGNAANADWWSFIAPFFADTHRVVSMSWSGMGGSSWRERYSLNQHLEEAMEIAEATGLFDGSVKPVFVAHSFGGFPSVMAAARHGERLGRVVLVDTPIFSAEKRRQRMAARQESVYRPHRVYETEQGALDRFRFIPPQDFVNLYIVDHIATHSIVHTDAEGGGWTWRFDPYLWRDYDRPDPGPHLAAARCPATILLGETSPLLDKDDIAYLRSILPEHADMHIIANSGHQIMVDQPLILVEKLRAALAS